MPVHHEVDVDLSGDIVVPTDRVRLDVAVRPLRVVPDTVVVDHRKVEHAIGCREMHAHELVADARGAKCAEPVPAEGDPHHARREPGGARHLCDMQIAHQPWASIFACT